ncbi:MAG: outer membrane protein assembly factor BamB family protein [Dermabacteraceae bacterium]
MSRFTRRTALASLPATGLLGATAAHAAPAGAPLPAVPSGSGGVRLAFLADTHADPENQNNMARMRAVFDAIETFDPTLVVHGGDVTEYGTEKEYDAFTSAIPDGLRDRIAAVPGNHETRWDATAEQLRHERIGEEVRVVDADGIRVILADTTAYQQEVAWWSESALAAIEDAMQRSKNMPRILVTHFPMGAGYYYVANQQDLEDVLARHPIMLHLTGHTHRELMTRVNRRDQLEAAAVKTVAAYYELTGDISDLQVTRVEIPDLAAPAETARTPVTSYDLRPEHGRDSWLPGSTDVVDEGEVVAVEVSLPESFQGSVEATLYDTAVYAGRNDNLEWAPLQKSGRRYAGRLDASELARGAHRMHLRVRPEDPSGDRLLTFPYLREDTGIAWDTPIGGMIQGGLTTVDRDGEELLLVGSSTGQVRALDRAGSVQWSSAMVGEIRHDLLALEDGASVAVPDTAGYLHRLGADGAQQWRYATSAPFGADPGLGEIDGAQVLFACAGTSLHAIDASSGTALWTAELPAPSMGAPATDGTHVYLGAGDGSAHALDARTGDSVWTTSITDRVGSYQRFIYGPWNDAITILPDGGVLVSGISDTQCLDPGDGSVRWRFGGSFQYAREAVTAAGDLVMADERGRVVRLDPATGAELASYQTAERILDEGFVLVEDVVYTASHSGLISAVDLASGAVEKITRVANAPVLARGTAFGDHHPVAPHAGTVPAGERLGSEPSGRPP